MQKLLKTIIIAAAVLLSACQAAGSGGGKVTVMPATATVPAATPTQTQPPAVATRDPKAVAMECEVVSANPTPGPTEESLFPPVSDEDWVLGDAQAAVMTITEYSDFQ